MRKWLALFALVFGLMVFPSHAQDSIRISSVRVDVWPEFDRPAVLVIYNITLAADTSLPALLNLRVPAQAMVNAVAVEDPSLGLLIADYNRTVSGDWATLSITATTLDIQVEYYDVLVKNGNTRSIYFEWVSDSAIDAFSIVFQVPARASNVKVDPVPALSQRDSFDLLNYVTETVSLDAGETFILTAQYEKTDDELSIASLPVEPAIPLEETSGQTAWGEILPWILGGLGLALIILGIFFLFSYLGVSGWRGKKGTPKRRERHAQRVLKLVDDPVSVHCHECGRRAQQGDQFCRSCGSRLRHEE